VPALRSSGIDSLRIESVTGVDVELPIAGPGSRSYAFIIDWHIRLLLAFLWVPIALAIMYVVHRTPSSNSALNHVFSLKFFVYLPATMIYLLYHPIVELAMGGQTPGKRKAGVCVVTRTGQPPSIAAILIRNVFRLIDSFPAFYTVGLLSTIITRDNVRIGDLAAGTVLVTLPDDGRKAPERQAVFATQSRLTPDQVELVSDVLERWPQLDTVMRRSLAQRILTQVGANVTDADDQALRSALVDLLAPGDDGA
jgi:uncharacterized RDD family membrane protein YckC